MAQFPGLSLTAQGHKMILRASTGKVADRLIVTKAIIGDGQLNTSIEGLTRLVSAKLEIGLSQVKELANGQMQLQFNFDNKKVDTGFYWREVGLYAKSGDSGEEKLIGYSNAKGLTSYIPDKTNALPMQRLVIALGVGDNPNVKGFVDLTSAITLEQLEEAINQHNTDTNAHNNQFAKYLPLAGGTVTGNVKLNNAAIGFNNGNNTYDTKIRIASNGNFDIGVTEDNSNKNSTTQLLLHSQNKPKWYNSDSGGKEIAIVEDITNHNTDETAHRPLTSAIAKILGDTNWKANPIANLKDIKNLLGMGGIVSQRLEETGFIKFANGLIIQWGILRRVAEAEQGGNGMENQQVRRFPIQFATNKAILVCGDCGNNKNESNAILAVAVGGAVSVRGRIVDKTSFKVAVDASDETMDVDISYIAVGI